MDRLARTVRQQVALGRLLPLGGAGDPAWIAESAAVRLLRGAAAGVAGVRVGRVAVAPADEEAAAPGAAPAGAPLGALPHLPLRVDAAFEAAAGEPVQVAAERLREALWVAARDAVGLDVAVVDLRVTGLIEDGDGPGAEPGPEAAEPAEPAEASEASEEVGPGIVRTEAEAAAAAVRAVPGVARLSGRLVGLGPGVRVVAGPGGATAVQVQIEVAPGHVPLRVARDAAGAARSATNAATAAVVVT
jgi:hypothetical protein